jgi:hypothetical protein
MDSPKERFVCFGIIEGMSRHKLKTKTKLMNFVCTTRKPGNTALGELTDEVTFIIYSLLGFVEC